MGKFMIDDIMTLLRVATGVQDGVPYKDERPLLEGLSDNGVGDVCGGKSNFKMTKRSLGGNDGRGVDQDGQDVPVKFMRQAEKKEACLGGYRHTDFVGQFKPAATFPMFFSKEYLDEGFQSSLLSGIEHAIVGDVTADDLFPCGGKGHFGKFPVTEIGKPLKHQGSLSNED